MRRGFSIGQALGAPFSLLRRRPGTLFVWGLLRLIFGALVLAAIWPMLGEMIGEIAALEAAGREAMPTFSPEAVRLQALAQGLSLLQGVLGVVIFTAAMRATVAGKARAGFAFLRVGMDELRVGVAGLAIFIGLYIGVVVLAVLGVGVFFAAWSLGEPVAIPIIVGYGVIAALVVIWAMSRAMLIMPVSLIEKTFAFDTGWALGKGQSVRLAITGFLAFVILMLIEAVFVALIVAAAVAVASASGGSLNGLEWTGEQPPTLEQARLVAQPFWPLLFLILPAILLTGFVSALFASPLASAALQLLDSSRPKSPPADVDPLDDGLSPIVPAAALVAAEPAGGQSSASHHGSIADPVEPAPVEATADPHAGDHAREQDHTADTADQHLPVDTTHDGPQAHDDGSHPDGHHGDPHLKPGHGH